MVTNVTITEVKLRDPAQNLKMPTILSLLPCNNVGDYLRQLSLRKVIIGFQAQG